MAGEPALWRASGAKRFGQTIKCFTRRALFLYLRARRRSCAPCFMALGNCVVIQRHARSCCFMCRGYLRDPQVEVLYLSATVLAAYREIANIVNHRY